MARILQTALVVFLSASLVACATESAEESAGDAAAGVADSDSAGSDEGVARPNFPEPAPVVHEVPAQTTLTFKVSSRLSTESSAAGDEFTAALAEAVVVDGVTVLPANAVAMGHVVNAERSGRVSGVARLELTMTRVEANGTSYELNTAPFVAQAQTERGEDAARIGAGAGIGAAIGAALGGGQGAAVGAAIGGGTGTAVVLSDRGDEVVIPEGTAINFLLSDALRVSLE